jgi:4-hydroxyacetophenone monooxygenase
VTTDDAAAPGRRLDEVAPGRQLRVTVIGAGISGIAVAHRLRQAGVPVTVLEKNADVGGTWFENIYPGCRVDVPSELYSYSFAPRAGWEHHFSEQPVWLDYLREVARTTGIRDCTRFGTEVLGARWQGDSWALTVRDAEGTHELVTDVLVPAVGQLNRPALPRIPGRESFSGPAFHSAQWRSDVPLAGRRVGVIGTGASAFQFVPAIADEAASVTVFQRTPPWLLPTPNYHERVDETTRWLHERLPVHAAWYRIWLLLLEPALVDMPGRCAVDPDFPPTERAVSAANERLRELFTAHIAAQLDGAPELLEQVVPRYPVGAKRMLRDDGLWLATLRRDDVELVTEPIEEITPSGVCTRDGAERPFDVLLYGTGFTAQDFLAPMEIVGRDGQDLRAWWAGEPRAHLGLTVPGFPNLFCMYGPNTNLVVQGGSITHLAECQARYVTDAVRLLATRGAVSMELRPEVYVRSGEEIDRANARQVWGWSAVSSWYKNAAGRVTQSWPFLSSDYWQRTRRVACDDYDWS